jgi:hypothetical protein
LEQPLGGEDVSEDDLRQITLLYLERAIKSHSGWQAGAGRSETIRIRTVAANDLKIVTHS